MDDEPSSMIRGEKRLLSRTAPVRLVPKRRHLAKAYPEFDGYLKQLECKYTDTAHFFFLFGGYYKPLFFSYLTETIACFIPLLGKAMAAIFLSRAKE